MSRAGGYQVVEGLPNPAKLVRYVQQTAAAPLTRRRGDMIFLDQHTALELRSQDGGGPGWPEWRRMQCVIAPSSFLTPGMGPYLRNHELRIYHLCSEVR